MKTTLTLHLLIFLSLSLQQHATAQVILYASRQTGQASSKTGSYSKSTDSYVNGIFNLTATGPIVQVTMHRNLPGEQK